MNNPDPETDAGRVLLIDKPYRWTSFDVVKKIRRVLNVRKAGHAGTLDPLATGLLIVCTGKKTKEISHFQDLLKEYTGTFTLGETRPSHDHETAVSIAKDASDLTRNDIAEACYTFKGETMQVPPDFSAVKQGGKPAYKLARKGEKLILEPRKVVIYEFEITGISMPDVSFRILTSKGFYVRSLVRDIGEKLGCGACLSQLRRTKIGNYSVQDALDINNLIPVQGNENL
jgi:tRNA pseudouridine55 synthase